MPAYGREPETNGRRRDVIFAAVVLLMALLTSYVSDASQERIAASLQVSVLRPFIATQERLVNARHRASRVEDLTARLDSLSALVSTQSALADENRTLRDMLALSERAGQAYLPATVLRPGTPGSESMFLVDVGSNDGVEPGAPVVSPNGLVGRIREVRPESAVGMDWSHPDFRASAMLVDGSVYGIVENRRGRFREEDRLVLNGMAYNEVVASGMAVVTSGLSGVLPRGIPIGRIETLEATLGTWNKSYWLEPMVVPGSVTHALVLTRETGDDVSRVWPPDSLITREEAVIRDPGP